MLLLLSHMISNKGIFLGQIRAKGLHTSLLVTVMISDDCRFGFAGVSKGSMEMLAFDISRLPVWSSCPGAASFGNTLSKSSLTELISLYRHLDPKLRGFGAVISMQDAASPGIMKYRLACGRGIKNVHIFDFCPRNADGTTSWQCIYDVASNGNTLESLRFRRGGMEVVSKSVGANLRLWDMSAYERDPQAKMTFEDIPNTQDVRCLVDDYAFAGTYEFTSLTLCSPSTRETIELPDKISDDMLNESQTGDANTSASSRKRRQFRQINSMVGTQDGRHVLSICTDGGVLYLCQRIQNTSSSSSSSSSLSSSSSSLSSSTSSSASAESSECAMPNTTTATASDISERRGRDADAGFEGVLTELYSLQTTPSMDPNVVCSWCLKLVGQQRAPVLLRMAKAEHGILSVRLLGSGVYAEEQL